MYVLVLHALFLFIALFFRNLIANLVFMRIKTHVGCDNYQNCSTTSQDKDHPFLTKLKKDSRFIPVETKVSQFHIFISFISQVTLVANFLQAHMLYRVPDLGYVCQSSKIVLFAYFMFQFEPHLPNLPHLSHQNLFASFTSFSSYSLHRKI